MSVETVILSKIINEGDEALQFFIQKGVSSEYFTEKKSAEAFDFIKEHWHNHGNVPTVRRFQSQYPTFKLVEVEDTLSSLVEELRNHHAYHVAAELTPKIVNEFEKEEHEFDLDTVLTNIAELQQGINVITASNDVVMGSEFARTYLQEMLEMDPDDMTGLPTGIKSLDEASGGWQPEQFIVFGAAPKRFKSTILQYSAMACRNMGYTVGFVTHEMSNKEMMEREYCFGAQVDLNHIQRRTLHVHETDRLEQYVRDIAKLEGEIVYVHDVNAATTLSGLTAIARSQKKPWDALFIDGLYRMTDDSKKYDNDTAALTGVSRGCKRLASHLEIPVVSTTQALLSRMSKTQGTHMDSFGYTRAFAQDANVLLGIDRNDLQKNDIIVKVIAARSMVGTNLGMYVDYERGEIIETGEVEIDGSADASYNNG